jgi:hypothetical protein
MSSNENQFDDESFRLLMQDAGLGIDSTNNNATDAANHALATFATRNQRRQKIRNAAVPVLTLLMFVAGTFYWGYANRRPNGIFSTQTDEIACYVSPEKLAEKQFEAQLADLQQKINELQAQVTEQKRLFEEHEHKTALEMKLASRTVKTQAERIADLNREFDRRFELEKNASTFLNFARKYIAENKKDLAIAEYNVVLRSFSESETAKLAEEELKQINAF